MRKVKKILDIYNQEILLFPGTSTQLEINNVIHSPVHYHSSCIEMIFCLKGSVNVHCNHETVKLNKGEIFTVGFDDIHCLFSDTDNVVISFYIDMKSTGIPWKMLSYTYFSCEDNNCDPYQLKPLQKIKSCILAAAYKFSQDDNPDTASINTACHKILDLLMTHFDFYNRINFSPDKDNELRQRFRDIMAYCANNHDKKLTIAQVAEVVHISQNYFSQFIHKSGYKSFNGLLGYVRCFEAQKLLLTTELTVIQISDKCGFANVNSFYKHFHEIWGTTPKEYRQWFSDYVKIDDLVIPYSKEEIFPVLAPFVAEHFVNTTLAVE